VVNDLKQELPGLRQFATLSPIPGFAHWLGMLLAERPDPGGEAGLHEAERQLLQGTAHPDWHRDPPLAAALQPLLSRLCARYLNEVDQRKRRARDPVAHFHLGNGASIARLNWMADVSAKGLSQSFGMMVNYLYDPREIDANSENYSRSLQIACAPALRDNPGRRRWPWQPRPDDATVT
jgi:malonyl-CoA decarboxylase